MFGRGSKTRKTRNDNHRPLSEIIPARVAAMALGLVDNLKAGLTAATVQLLATLTVLVRLA
jgi:hypothetical protein